MNWVQRRDCWPPGLLLELQNNSVKLTFQIGMTGRNISYVKNNIRKGIERKGLHGEQFLLAGQWGVYKAY